jgi:hypothetical protein
VFAALLAQPLCRFLLKSGRLLCSSKDDCQPPVEERRQSAVHCDDVDKGVDNETLKKLDLAAVWFDEREQARAADAEVETTLEQLKKALLVDRDAQKDGGRGPLGREAYNRALNDVFGARKQAASATTAPSAASLAAQPLYDA